MAVLTDSLLTKVVELLDNQIDFGGIGTGTAPTQTSTSLDSEQIRKVVTGYTDGTTLIKEIFLAENEANGVNYTNAGLFDETATSTVDTGVLLFGSDINLLKNNSENATISFEISVKRGV
jgi:hypothetical protein